ncbi:bleomycin resistance protein [Microbacterium arborescens]|uniref:bleomycin resistance protein n=1 Tax=Microbacterium arborescens TaxID=33883 RepID=UPI003C78750A
MTDHAVPNLPSRDFEVTSAFYGGFGFRQDHRSEDWLILSRGTVRSEFFPYPDLVPEASSFMCSIRVDDADEFYRRVRESGVTETPRGMPRLQPIEPQPWGQRAGFLVDPDGTQLHLIENIDPSAADPTRRD